MSSLIRCFIIDDEPLAIDILVEYVEKLSGLKLVGTTTNAIEGLKVVQEGNVDLVFLDVEMPEITGIQFLKIVDGRCGVILTTAYPEYALDGFELDVMDYLLKPIAFDRFSRAVNKFSSSYLARTSTGLTASEPSVGSDESQVRGEQQQFFFVKTENRIQKIDLDEVLYIEGLKDYVSIYTLTERVVTLQGMKKMEEFLPSNRFLRVHRSYIIALDKIKSIEKSRIYIQEKVIPIGDTFRETFYKYIGEKNG